MINGTSFTDYDRSDKTLDEQFSEAIEIDDQRDLRVLPRAPVVALAEWREKRKARQ